MMMILKMQNNRGKIVQKNKSRINMALKNRIADRKVKKL